MAEAAAAAAAALADEEDTTVVVRPLPIMGLADDETKGGEPDDDGWIGWSNGDGVMFPRAGGCPMGVMDLPEPVPTGAILLVAAVIVVVIDAVGATVAI